MTASKLFVGFSIARLISRALTAACLLLVIVAIAPKIQSQAQSERKILTRVQPKYPEYLRDHEIGGSVRLSVVVTPNGNVKSVTPVGGNPILVDAAVNAVKQWKYAPSETTETLEVRLDFVPNKTH